MCSARRRRPTGRPARNPLATLALLIALALAAAHGAVAETLGPWAALGVDVGASEEEVTRAFRALAREHHPDKGGDADRFVEIRAAYEELTERRAYWEGKGGGDGSQSDRGGSDFGSGGWGDFGNFWHAEGESQWREVKMRVKLRFLGGTLEMPAEDYMTSPRGVVNLRHGLDGEVTQEPAGELDSPDAAEPQGDARRLSRGQAGIARTSVAMILGASDDDFEAMSDAVQAAMAAGNNPAAALIDHLLNHFALRLLLGCLGVALTAGAIILGTIAIV
eukprot:PRCOL_00005832-RA